MEYLLDTVNLARIEKMVECLPIDGVTSNPSIIKNDGVQDFFEHMREIRSIIGNERTLHIQVTAQDVDGMLRDAEKILEKIDEHVYIKVPTTMEGLKVIKQLKGQNIHVTATAIYTLTQCLLAVKAGVDYLAPYYNRMEGLNINSEQVIQQCRQMIDQSQSSAKILAASFKNISQVNKAFIAGAQSVTLDPSLIEAALNMPDITKAVNDFEADWLIANNNKFLYMD
ncbi:fructose-6-phosphate aldolase [Vallitaleaceae bacterium 9-2]